MSALKALIQNCKMANATSNYTAVVFTENDIPRAALEDANLKNLKKKPVYSRLGGLGAIMNMFYSQKSILELKGTVGFKQHT